VQICKIYFESNRMFLEICEFRIESNFVLLSNFESNRIELVLVGLCAYAARHDCTKIVELTVVTKEVNKIFFYQGIAESKVI
jgi:hypothetical protein